MINKLKIFFKQLFCGHYYYDRPFKDSDDYDKFSITICKDCGKMKCK